MAKRELVINECEKGGTPLTNEEWLKPQPKRCYFYPARDCPGWGPGGTCSRIGDTIPEGTDND